MSIVVRRLGRFPKREPGLCNEVFVCSLCLSLSTREWSRRDHGHAELRFTFPLLCEALSLSSALGAAWQTCVSRSSLNSCVCWSCELDEGLRCPLLGGLSSSMQRARWRSSLEPEICLRELWHKYWTTERDARMPSRGSGARWRALGRADSAVCREQKVEGWLLREFS